MKFKSRRNAVYLVDNLIQKHFCNEKAYNQEISNLKFLRQKKIRVPNIISFSYPILSLEYIEGENFCDFIDSANDIQMESLYCWFKEYHSATNSLRGDVNLRNFIITKDNVTYSVDFEEKIIKGDSEKDYGKVIAFIATYSPQFSDEKVGVALKLFENFKKDNLDIEKIENYYFDEIEMMKLRRKVDLDFLENANVFFNKIKNV